ncbi:helix-turn-helix domain-containing protein [Microbacterium sp. 22242]|uniref:helix-turn-helix domain-containing protein n=1 Tax=Microbacterium sp. 22242 TaxID=3453896 RepID=UPI003F867791
MEKTMVPADELRRLRNASGLSQRALAARTGISQPNIAAYESGRRMPSVITEERLRRALRVPTLARVRHERDAILAAAERGMVENVRVFGSVARGDADEDSDLDLLVRPLHGASLIEFAAFAAEVGEILGVRVDVVSDRSTAPAVSQIAEEAVPL